MGREVQKTKARDYLRDYPVHGNLGSWEDGRNNEQRVAQILKGLVAQGMYRTFKKATGKQNKAGIDFWIYQHGEANRIPIQVKSSAREARSFREERSNLIVPIVANPMRDDVDIIGQIVSGVAWSRFKDRAKITS